MFKPLGGMLPDALSRMKVRKPVEAAVVCRACDGVLGSFWEHSVPMRAVTFARGTVTVAVTSSAWAQEVSSHSEQVKDKLNQKLAGHSVKRVRTKVSPKQARGETTDA